MLFENNFRTLILHLEIIYRIAYHCGVIDSKTSAPRKLQWDTMEITEDECRQMHNRGWWTVLGEKRENVELNKKVSKFQTVLILVKWLS